MGKLVVAVSGGVDSVVLLHTLVTEAVHTLVVAHFDHGIRDDSHQDAQFVQALAKRYGLPFEMRREELGKMASEDEARTRRYRFLREVAKKHQATIATAHHADDIIETVAINMIRGTGWRGLAVLDSEIHRPLLMLHKADLVRYAKEHALSWREDSTNATDAYLRNRVRRKLDSFDTEKKRQVLALWAAQCEVKNQIDNEIKRLPARSSTQSRYFVAHIEERAALEYLRAYTQGLLTRPQLGRLLLAIKTSKAGKVYQAGSGVEIRFTARHFTLEMVK